MNKLTTRLLFPLYRRVVILFTFHFIFMCLSLLSLRLCYNGRKTPGSDMQGEGQRGGGNQSSSMRGHSTEMSPTAKKTQRSLPDSGMHRLRRLAAGVSEPLSSSAITSKAPARIRAACTVSGESDRTMSNSPSFIMSYPTNNARAQ